MYAIFVVQVNGLAILKKRTDDYDIASDLFTKLRKREVCREVRFMKVEESGYVLLKYATKIKS